MWKSLKSHYIGQSRYIDNLAADQNVSNDQSRKVLYCLNWLLFLMGPGILPHTADFPLPSEVSFTGSLSGLILAWTDHWLTEYWTFIPPPLWPENPRISVYCPDWPLTSCADVVDHLLTIKNAPSTGVLRNQQPPTNVVQYEVLGQGLVRFSLLQVLKIAPTLHFLLVAWPVSALESWLPSKVRFAFLLS